MFLKAILVLVILFVLFIAILLITDEIWKRTPYGKLELLLKPLKRRLEEHVDIACGEIEELAGAPELRSTLYNLLRRHKRAEMFPEEHQTVLAQAESALTYWLFGPKALKEAPSAIEYVETIQREIWGKPGDFYVFRFKAPVGHVISEGWILGVAGPFFAEGRPYWSAVKGFSVLDATASHLSSNELVDLYARQREAGPEPIAPFEDPIFGNIELGKRGWQVDCFFVPLGVDVTITLEAGKEGPSQAQRDFFRRLEKQYTALVVRMESRLVDVYGDEYGPEVVGCSASEFFHSLSLKSISISRITEGAPQWAMEFESELNGAAISFTHLGWQFIGEIISG